MKKYVAYCLVLALCAGFFSFSGNRGGDHFEIYLNGKKVHQQFVHINPAAKTLHLNARSGSDQIGVVYSHCGQPGTNRVITFRNEKNEVVKKLAFGNGNDHRSVMRFSRRDVATSGSAKLALSYSAKELPEGRLLATVAWDESIAIDKR